jgi:hypothetical protein
MFILVVFVVAVCLVIAFVEENRRVKTLTGKSLWYFWKKGGK